MENRLSKPKSNRFSQILSERLKEFEEVIKIKEFEVTSKNFFELFGLNTEFSESDLKVAYHKSVKELRNPQFYDKVSDETRETIDNLFEQITQAYEILKDEKSRCNYKELIKQQANTSYKLESSPNYPLFRSGIEYIKNKNYEMAISEFERAINNGEIHGDYYIFLGWALFQDSLLKRKNENIIKAKDYILKGISLNPKNYMAYKFLARIALEENRKYSAINYLKKALSLKPDSEDIQKQLEKLKEEIYTEKTKEIKKEYNEVEKEIIAKYNEIKGLNYYQVLGVEDSLNVEEFKKNIKNARIRLVKQYHPDLFYGKIDKDVRDMLDTIIAKINKAYVVLSNNKLKQIYDQNLKAKNVP